MNPGFCGELPRGPTRSEQSFIRLFVPLYLSQGEGNCARNRSDRDSKFQWCYLDGANGLDLQLFRYSVIPSARRKA